MRRHGSPQMVPHLRRPHHQRRTRQQRRPHRILHRQRRPRQQAGPQLGSSESSQRTSAQLVLKRKPEHTSPQLRSNRSPPRLRYRGWLTSESLCLLCLLCQTGKR